jgi:hypothetical protein
MSCYCVMCEHHRSAEGLLRRRGEPVPPSIDTQLEKAIQAEWERGDKQLEKSRDSAMESK